MKFLFKSRKKSDVSEPGKVVSGIAGCLSRIQKAWAEYMNRRYGKLSPKAQSGFFFLFFVAMGFMCTYCIGRVFFETPRNSGLTAISISKPLLPQERRPAQGKSIISEGEFLRIQQFKIYMDSLARSPGGKAYRDSLLNAHPGLMDSVARVEEIYRMEHSFGKRDNH